MGYIYSLAEKNSQLFQNASLNIFQGYRNALERKGNELHHLPQGLILNMDEKWFFLTQLFHLCIKKNHTNLVCNTVHHFNAD